MKIEDLKIGDIVYGINRLGVLKKVEVNSIVFNNKYNTYEIGKAGGVLVDNIYRTKEEAIAAYMKEAHERIIEDVTSFLRE